ncbi:hypothetical protein JCM11641_002163 [Rhodosporidiobolus odoratus]
MSDHMRSSSCATTPPPAFSESSAASTSRVSSPIPASLSTLPPELKALIVQKVHEADIAAGDAAEDEAGWSDDEEEDEGSEASSRVGEDRGAKIASAMHEVKEKLDAAGMGAAFDSWVEGRDPKDFVPHIDIEKVKKFRDQLIELAQPNGIEALTLVCRDLSEMAMPFFWRNLDFSEVANESILHLINDVLPSRAHHIESVAFGQSDAPMLHGEQPTLQDEVKLRDSRLRVVTAIEELSGAENIGSDGKPLIFERRCRRARSLVMAEVIKRCPNVTIIDFEGFPKVSPDRLDEFEEAAANDPDRQSLAYPIDHALEGIKTHLGPKLTNLNYLVNEDGLTTEGDVAGLLSVCPNLLRLELEILVPQGPATNRDKLHQSLLSLTKLETFNLVQGDFVNDAFAQLDLQCPLKVLALSECEDLSFPSFISLVERFSSTLECLDIAGTPHNDNERDAKKYLGQRLNLPKLDTLVLETPHEPVFLKAFSACRVKVFGLGFCPAIGFADIEAFMDEHLETLRRIEVEYDAALTEAQVESLEVLCHARGIECELMQPDDSDLSDEDDPSAFGLSDEDDLDQDDGWGEDDHDDDSIGGVGSGNADEVDLAEDGGGWSDEE